MHAFPTMLNMSPQVFSVLVLEAVFEYSCSFLTLPICIAVFRTHSCSVLLGRWHQGERWHKMPLTKWDGGSSYSTKCQMLRWEKKEHANILRGKCNLGKFLTLLLLEKSTSQAREGGSSLHFSCQRCVGSVEFSGPILLPYMHSVVQSDSEGIRCIFNH